MSAAEWVEQGATIPELRRAATGCRGCELWEPATQVVFSAGNERAPMMLVGEQPGDQEDQQGIPFVGPAGTVLQRALADAGIERSQVYVTNAVKHFRFELRGKRRIHATPQVSHIKACKPWLEAEVARVRPELVVALGATAGKSLMGSDFRITRQRGQRLSAMVGELEVALLATIHPSAVLRTPEGSERDQAYAGLVADLDGRHLDRAWNNAWVTRVVIIGGGPGGYEAALVGSQLGGDVTLIDTDGLGGSAVLTDCVPSKTLIATAEVMSEVKASPELGLRFGKHGEGSVDTNVGVDLAMVNRRVKRLAQAQSADIVERVRREGIRLVTGRGRLDGPERVIATTASGEQSFDADVVMVSTGAHPRVLPDAVPDGERILTWTQVYEMSELPDRLIVVGSGVTGAEFASAYDALGVDVVLVSSRDRVLPGEDADAARVLEDVFTRRGMTVLSRSRAASVTRHGDVVTVALTDGRTVTGSHCLLAVGSIPNTADLGLIEAGVTLDRGGFVEVDRVSRTSARGVYAAGDCTGVLMLASVAAMQGRIAMWHSLGDAVAPLDLHSVSSNVFTEPEIATVGATQELLDNGQVRALTVNLPLRGNPRAKMQGIRDGFVKLFCLPATGIIVGGVVVAPRASELIHPVAVAVAERVTVDQLAQAFTVYPSLSGSVAEAARRLHGHSTEQLPR